MNNTNTLDDGLLPSSEHQYIFYRSFMDIGDALEIEELLKKHAISYLLDVPRKSLDASIIGEGMVVKATLKVLATEKTKVDTLLAEKIKTIAIDELQNHSLQTSSDEDLYEMLIKPDEWPIENLIAAVLLFLGKCFYLYTTR